MSWNRESPRIRAARLAAILFLVISPRLFADQIEMQNGDHYFGKILAVTTNTVVLESDVLGTVPLPRSRIALLTLGSSASTNMAAASPLVTNGQPHAPRRAPLKPAAVAKEPGIDKNVIQKVESQYLSEATPEARAKFNQLAGGLLTGRLTVNDIRKEAKSAADQLRALRADAGDDTGMVDSYLAILDNFLKEGGPAEVPGGKGEGGSTATNGVVSLPKAKPGVAQQEE
jgi:hypothetical protein